MKFKSQDNSGKYGGVVYGNIHGPRPGTASLTAPLDYSEQASPVVKIGESFATVSTGANTTETDIHTYTLPANMLNRNGATVEMTSKGTFAANGNNKTLKVYWGGVEVFTSGAVAANATTWNLTVTVTRDATQTQRIYVDGQVNNTQITTVYTTGARDETTTQVLKIMGTNGTAAAADISGKLSELFYTM